MPGVKSEAGERALRLLVETINVTGGVLIDTHGFTVPAADMAWADLGEAYDLACEALGVERQVGTNDEGED